MRCLVSFEVSNGRKIVGEDEGFDNCPSCIHPWLPRCFGPASQLVELGQLFPGRAG